MTFDQINEWRTCIRAQRRIVEDTIKYCEGKLVKLDDEMDATFRLFDAEYERTWPETTMPIKPLVGNELTLALKAGLAQLEAEQEQSDVA